MLLLSVILLVVCRLHLARASSSSRPKERQRELSLSSLRRPSARLETCQANRVSFFENIHVWPSRELVPRRRRFWREWLLLRCVCCTHEVSARYHSLLIWLTVLNGIFEWEAAKVSQSKTSYTLHFKVTWFRTTILVRVKIDRVRQVSSCTLL